MSKVFLRQGLHERPKEGGLVPEQGGKAMLGAFLRNLHLPTPHPQGSLRACRKQVAIPRAPDGLWGWQWERGSHVCHEEDRMAPVFSRSFCAQGSPL